MEICIKSIDSWKGNLYNIGEITFSLILHILTLGTDGNMFKKVVGENISGFLLIPLTDFIH